VVVAAAAWLALGPRLGLPGAAAQHAERSAVAVLGLRNATGRPDAAWLSAALAEMLSTELGAGDALRAVPGETVARAVADLALAPSDSLAAVTLDRLHRTLGAEWVVLGSFTALGGADGGPLRLDLRLQRTDGTRDLPLSAEGSEGELFDLVARAGRELRGALGVAEPDGAGPPRSRTALPGSEEAVRLYSQGLEKLRGGDPLAARELLEAALAEDGEAPLAWSALARAWSELGYTERSREAARTAWQKSARLPRADALEVEARFRLASGEWDAAIANYRALWRFYPDDLEQGLALATALLEAERGAEALTVLAELRALPAPAGEDPRIDLAEARAADGLSDFRRALGAARRAEAAATALGAKSLVARAEYERGIALRKLGDAEGSRAALLDARRRSAEAGDRAGVALALMSLANLERGQGRLDEAGSLFAEARSTFAALGNRSREARAELSQGLVLSSQGDLAGAVKLYEDALAKLREAGDRRGAAVALANVGTMRYELGDLAGALARHGEALAEFRALGDEARVVVALENISQCRLDRGELAAAAAPLEEALAISRRTGDRAGEGYSLKALGDLAAERGEVEAAARRYEEATAVFRAAGLEPWLRLTGLAAAVLDRARGRGAEAERALAALVPEFATAGMAGDRDEAAIERVRTLAGLGRVAEAGALEPGLLARAAGSDSRRLRHLARLAEAELALAAGRSAAARAPLAVDLAEASGAGFVLQALETRALLARVLAAAGDPGAARLAAEVAAEAGRIGSARIRALLGGAAGGAQGVTGGV
jgi:tetratricopeptide (TPR) repeat protein/TolB-like protein